MKALHRMRLFAVALVVALFASTSWGALTGAQLTTLATDINAQGSLSAARSAKDATIIANFYNANASPDFWVWRTSVSKAEYYQSTSIDGTIFSFVGAGFITRTQGERDAWRDLFDAQGFANPALPQVRQAVADIFSGATAPAPANRTHLLTVSRRKAKLVEKLFAVGTGSTAVPATMDVEGSLRAEDVQQAMGW
jgi:hypothetical protein